MHSEISLFLRVNLIKFGPVSRHLLTLGPLLPLVEASNIVCILVESFLLSQQHGEVNNKFFPKTERYTVTII